MGIFKSKLKDTIEMTSFKTQAVGYRQNAFGKTFEETDKKFFWKCSTRDSAISGRDRHMIKAF